MTATGGTAGVDATTAGRVTARSGSAEDGPRDAIVYLPGLELGMTTGKSVVGVVTRIQVACEVQADSDSAAFSVRWHDAAISAEATGPVATILRKDGDVERPVIDVFTYDWSTPFAKRWNDQNSFVKMVRVILTLLGLRRFLRFFRSAGKRSQKGSAQLVVAFLAVAVMVAYAALLLYAAILAGQQALQLLTDDTEASNSVATTTSSPVIRTTTPATQPDSGADNEPEIKWAQIVALLSAALVPILPKVRKHVETAGSAMSAASDYLRLGADQPRVVQGLVRLVDNIGKDGKHPNVDIVSYSLAPSSLWTRSIPQQGHPNVRLTMYAR